jgi:hypothetical protein
LWQPEDAAVWRIGRTAGGAKPTYATLNLNAPMPSLENLRKQAKLILRWHRERYYPVAAQIRAVLPRFRHFGDPEILALPFSLSDALEMVARQAGFYSWEAMKAGIATMPQTAAQTTTRPTISATAAQLFVADIKASCDFFVDKLGF